MSPRSENQCLCIPSSIDSKVKLALKHRQNKNQRQRVIVFVGSPLSSSSATELVKLGKKMKKNNVAVDVINFGEDTENEEVLRQFVESVNSSDNRCASTIYHVSSQTN